MNHNIIKVDFKNQHVFKRPIFKHLCNDIFHEDLSQYTWRLKHLYRPNFYSYTITRELKINSSYDNLEIFNLEKIFFISSQKSLEDAFFVHEFLRVLQEKEEYVASKLFKTPFEIKNDSLYDRDGQKLFFINR